MKETMKKSRVRSPGDLESQFFHQGTIIGYPPGSDWKCDCCGKHISELKPFVKAGDPLVGDFNGPLLVKRDRPMILWSEEALNKVHEAFKKCGDHERLEKWLIDKYGEEEGRSLYEVHRRGTPIKDSWECRDCIILDDYEYIEIVDSRWSY